MGDTPLLQDLDDYLKDLQLDRTARGGTDIDVNAFSTIPEVRIGDFARYLRSVKWKSATNDESRTSSQRRDSNSPSSARDYPRTSLIDPVFCQSFFSLDSADLWKYYDDDDSEVPYACGDLATQLDMAEVLLLEEIRKQNARFMELAALIDDLAGRMSDLFVEVSTRKEYFANIDADVQLFSADSKRLVQRKSHLDDVRKIGDELQNVKHSIIVLSEFMHAEHWISANLVDVLDLLDTLKGFAMDSSLAGLAITNEVSEYVNRFSSSLTKWLCRELNEFGRIDCRFSAEDLLGFVSEQKIRHADSLPLEELTNSFNCCSINNDDSDRFVGITTILRSMNRLGCLKSGFQEFQSDIHDQAYNFLLYLVRLISERTNMSSRNLRAVDEVVDVSSFVAELSSTNYSDVLQAMLFGSRILFDWCQRLDTLTFKAFEELQLDVNQVVIEGCSQAARGAVSFWSTFLTEWYPLRNFSLEEFIEMMKVADVFSSLVYLRSKKSVSALQAALQAACRKVLSSVHSDAVEAVKRSLSEESWAFAEKSPDIQRRIFEIEERSDENRTGENSSLSCEVSNQGKEPGDEIQNDDHFVIGKEAYRMTESAQVVIKQVHQYLVLSREALSFDFDIGHRVFQLIGIFNATTCQLILGAGAMQSAGLKSISVKHLAITLQVLKGIMAIMPSLIANFVEPIELAARKSFLEKESSRIFQDLGSHCREIQNKIVQVMCDRLEANVASFREYYVKLNFMFTKDEENAPGGRKWPLTDGIASFLSKEIEALAPILRKNCLPSDYEEIFVSLMQRYLQSVPKLYSRLDVEKDECKERIEAECVLLKDAVKSLSIQRQHQDSLLSKISELRNVLFQTDRREASPEDGSTSE